MKITPLEIFTAAFTGAIFAAFMYPGYDPVSLLLALGVTLLVALIIVYFIAYMKYGGPRT